MGDGADAWHAVFEYLAIEPPHRLAYDSAFCDGAMLPCAPPFADDWPVHIRYEITLEEEGGITTLRLRGSPHDATPAQVATFREMFESMRAGFYATFDQLQSLLKEEP
jgi:uncharacterized protein YndB with AHSA1/START domain